MAGKSYPKKFDYGDADAEYAKFFDGCDLVRAKLREVINRHVTPREVDCVLVAATDLSRAS